MDISGVSNSTPIRAAATPAASAPPQEAPIGGDPRDILACPTPEIDRPFVIVPGWSTETKSLAGVTSLLTRDHANGGETYYVKQGKILEQDAKGDLLPVQGAPKNGKVFEMVLSDTRQSPDKNLPELKENFDAISKATGVQKVDVEGYSMGGLDTRLYLQNGGDHVNKFMMLGSPNHGTEFGEKVHDVLHDHLDGLVAAAHVTQRDAGSMEWLRLEKNSPELQKLNAGWAGELARTNGTLSVGEDGLVTLAPGVLPIELRGGDGTVPTASLSLPGAPTKVLHDRTQHGVLNDNQDVEQVRSDFFGWKIPGASRSSES